MGFGPVVARKVADDRDRPAGAVHPARLMAGAVAAPERFSRHNSIIFTTPMTETIRHMRLVKKNSMILAPGDRHRNS